MSNRGRLKEQIGEARRLIGAGDFAGARRCLDAMVLDPALESLGSPTPLGLPRKLQSALLALAKAEGDRMARVGYQFHLVPDPAILAGFARFTSAERQALTEANRQPVPRVLHQVWIGPKPPPVTTDAWRTHAAAHGFGYRLWREADLADAGRDRDLVFSAMLDRGDYPGAVDAARYRILRDEGGVYLDCDWFPARRDIGFADRLPLIGLTALAEDTPRLTGAGSLLLANSFIAAPPGHPVMQRLTEVLPAVLAALPEAPAWWSTGPLPFTVIARAGAVTLADSGLVAGTAPVRATSADIEALSAQVEREDGGLLLAWKPW